MNVGKPCEPSYASDWAIGNLRDQLSLELSRAVLGRIDLRKATYTAIVADRVDTSGVIDFRSGGKTDASPAPDALLAGPLKAMVQPNFVVFEYWMSRPNDPFLRTFAMPYRVWNGEVYQVFAAADAGTHPAWARGCANYSPLFHGFVFAGTPPPVFDPWRMAGEFSLTALIFGIFDGESYLMAHM